MRKLDRILGKGEKIELSLRAIVGTHTEGLNVGAAGGKQLGHPWMIITERRLLLASPGLISFEVRQFRRDGITSVELQQGLVRDRIIINGMGIREEWTFWRKLRDFTEKAVSIIQNDEYDRDGSVDTKSADPLSELKVRLARGEISETEFDSLKRKIG